MDVSKTRACPECGNIIAVTDQFCSKCFARLERPTFWRRLGAWFKSAFKPGSHTWVIGTKANFQTISKQGEKHVYHSLDEVPPELRAKFEKLQAEVKTKLGTELRPTAVSEDALKPGIIIRRDLQVFKFKDTSGKEQIYHSLDEMPPETRALFEKLQGRLNLPGQKTEG